MKALAICDKGLEDIAALEIKELIKEKSQIKDNCVLFSVKKLEDLCLLCYKSQSVSKILFLLDSFKFNNNGFSDNVEKNIEKINFDKWLDKKTTFVVRCDKINNNDLSTNEIERKTGEFIINNIKKNKKYNQKVNLVNPDIIFSVFINKNECYFGIDFAGFDLSKRTYKIFMHPASLKGPIAYSLVRIADYTKKDALLDPFSGSGIISIEAALFASNFPVHYFDKEKFAFLKFKLLKTDFNKFFKNIDKKINKNDLKIIGYDNSMKFVQYGRKNAKIAGIDKLIRFSRIDIEWLDTKFKKNTIDKIVTDIPVLSKFADKSAVQKAYKELFYQADFILKKNGIVVILTRDLNSIKKFYEEFKFKIIEEKKVYSGKQELLILKLKKS